MTLTTATRHYTIAASRLFAARDERCSWPAGDMSRPKNEQTLSWRSLR